MGWLWYCRNIAAGAAVLAAFLSGAPALAQSTSNLKVLDRQLDVLLQAGKRADAIVVGERALALRMKLLGDQHWDVSVTAEKLADLYRSSGKDKRAEEMYRYALGIKSKQVGEHHRDV